MSISIRQIDISDAAEVLRWENDVENWSASNNDSPYQLWDIVRLIESLHDIERAKQGRWMIIEDSSERRIGTVDLCAIDFDSNEAIVGILIANKSDRQKGFALESLKLIEEEALKLGLEKLTCMIHPTNHGSIKLFEKSNFNKIGLSDDKYLSDGVYIEALLFEKWLKE
ncbi:MAG: GNAT family N-acetyltransferase [Crocinitomicaceae bacterium]